MGNAKCKEGKKQGENKAKFQRILHCYREILERVPLRVGTAFIVSEYLNRIFPTILQDFSDNFLQSFSDNENVRFMENRPMKLHYRF